MKCNNVSVIATSLFPSWTAPATSLDTPHTKIKKLQNL